MRPERALPLAGLMLLSACTTTTAVRMHSAEELAGVTRSCAVALGDVAQFEEEPRLLFLLTVERAGQLACVRRWARRRNLQLVYLEHMERVPDAAPN